MEQTILTSTGGCEMHRSEVCEDVSARMAHSRGPAAAAAAADVGSFQQLHGPLHCSPPCPEP